MKLTEKIWIAKNKQNELWSNIEGTAKLYDYDNEDMQIYNEMTNLLYIAKRKKQYSTSEIVQIVMDVRKTIANIRGDVIPESEDLVLKKEQQIEVVKDGLQKLISFFTEFSFEPNFRFVNTLQNICADSIDKGKDYVRNYFKLTDNAYFTAIVDKMSSTEFGEILEKLILISPSKSINTRFKLYYGSQGTGKTTAAMAEANNNVMVCHSAMLPSDLMEDFKFNDGKAAFTPSALCKAMTEGKSIVLDEINLLPFESLRFLQSLLDGKTQFDYKGQIINIKPGFKVIGTMNLQVNGSVYSLPEPLVDRAEELKEFKLTADNLLGAII